MPVFDIKAGSLEIIFGRTKDFISANAGLEKELTDADIEGILFIQNHGEISAVEYGNYLGVSAKTAQRRLARLANLGLVEIIGERRWTKYKAVNK